MTEIDISFLWRDLVRYRNAIEKSEKSDLQAKIKMYLNCDVYSARLSIFFVLYFYEYGSK